MDKGEIFKHTFNVVPGQNGTFALRFSDYADPDGGRFWGFTSLQDLMAWLILEAEAYESKGEKHAQDEH